jgi:hypothetical protein
VFEKRASSHSAPRRRRPKTRRRFSADYVFGAARPKCRQPRPGKQGGLCPTMFSVRPRPPAPLNSTRLGAYCGVAALGSGCEAEPKASRRRGADCVAFQGFLSVVNYRSPLQSLRAKPYKADVGAIVGEPWFTPSHIGHVRVAVRAIGRVAISSEEEISARVLGLNL